MLLGCAAYCTAMHALLSLYRDYRTAAKAEKRRAWTRDFFRQISR